MKTNRLDCAIDAGIQSGGEEQPLLSWPFRRPDDDDATDTQFAPLHDAHSSM